MKIWVIIVLILLTVALAGLIIFIGTNIVPTPSKNILEHVRSPSNQLQPMS